MTSHSSPGYEWVHLWTRTSYEGGQTILVPVPLGQPAVFYRSDSAFKQVFESLTTMTHTEKFTPERPFLRSPGRQRRHSWLTEFWGMTSYLAEGLMTRLIKLTSYLVDGHCVVFQNHWIPWATHTRMSLKRNYLLFIIKTNHLFLMFCEYCNFFL